MQTPFISQGTAAEAFGLSRCLLIKGRSDDGDVKHTYWAVTRKNLVMEAVFLVGQARRGNNNKHITTSSQVNVIIISIQPPTNCLVSPGKAESVMTELIIPKYIPIVSSGIRRKSIKPNKKRDEL